MAEEVRWDPLDSLGSTGATVAANVRRLREMRGYAYTDLAHRLGVVGRPIPTLGLRKIESGGRRVDADDLLALAVALGVSPPTLLMPYSTAADYVVDNATALDEPCGWEKWWKWLTAQSGHPAAGDHMSLLMFISVAWPHPLAMRVSRELNAKHLAFLDGPSEGANGND